jgi:hypothetical protein
MVYGATKNVNGNDGVERLGLTGGCLSQETLREVSAREEEAIRNGADKVNRKARTCD